MNHEIYKIRHQNEWWLLLRWLVDIQRFYLFSNHKSYYCITLKSILKLYFFRFIFHLSFLPLQIGKPAFSTYPLFIFFKKIQIRNILFAKVQFISNFLFKNGICWRKIVLDVTPIHLDWNLAENCYQGEFAIDNGTNTNGLLDVCTNRYKNLRILIVFSKRWVIHIRMNECFL